MNNRPPKSGQKLKSEMEWGKTETCLLETNIFHFTNPQTMMSIYAKCVCI
jgi:hypothetical protein